MFFIFIRVHRQIVLKKCTCGVALPLVCVVDAEQRDEEGRPEDGGGVGHGQRGWLRRGGGLATVPCSLTTHNSSAGVPPNRLPAPAPGPGPARVSRVAEYRSYFMGRSLSRVHSTAHYRAQYSTVQCTHAGDGQGGGGDIYTAIMLLLGELSPSPAPLHAQKSKPLQQTPQQIYTGLSCCQGRLPPSPPASICQFYSTPNPQSTSSSRRRSLCVQHLVIAEWGKISTK